MLCQRQIASILYSPQITPLRRRLWLRNAALLPVHSAAPETFLDVKGVDIRHRVHPSFHQPGVPKRFAGKHSSGFPAMNGQHLGPLSYSSGQLRSNSLRPSLASRLLSTEADTVAVNERSGLTDPPVARGENIWIDRNAIILGNLPEMPDKASLEQLLSSYGRCSSIIPIHQGGAPTDRVRVTFEDPDAAAKVVADSKADKRSFILDGCTLTISHPAILPSSRTLLLYQPHVNVASLQQELLERGVQPLRMKPATAMDKGGLRFSTAEDAEEALSQLKDVVVDGQPVQFSFTHSGDESSKHIPLKRGRKDEETILVGGLPYEADRGTLETLFGSYGLLHSTYFTRKKNGIRTGWACITFKDPSVAKRIMEDAIEDIGRFALGQRFLRIIHPYHPPPTDLILFEPGVRVSAMSQELSHRGVQPERIMPMPISDNGLISFSSVEAAEEALSKLKDVVIEGRPVNFRFGARTRKGTLNVHGD